MKVGINYAWKNYGWDFGLPPQNDRGSAWGPRAEWRATIDAELAEFVELGLFAVRWFLLGDGTTYGIGNERPHLIGGNPAQWRFDDPPALSEEFLQDFAELLARCEQAGIKLLPSLVDFQFCFPGAAASDSGGVVKGGRSDVLCDPVKRTQFFDRVLRPLLEVASARRSVIYAFEVMNEPEWCTRHPSSPAEIFDSQRTVPLADMRAFLREGAEIINEADFLSTVGFAKRPTVDEWDSPGLGMTLHQFHFYAEPPSLPSQVFDPRWPLIVGEFATAVHRPWQDLGPAQDLLSRLHHVADKGFPVAFLWSANRAEEHSANPPAVDFSESNRALIRRYTSGE